MNRLFLGVIAVYLILMLIAVFLTDWTVNAREDRALLRVGIYTPIVASSLLMAASAVWSATHTARWGILTIVRWPPEWDYNVAGWATSKALFFFVLWLYGMGWQPPDWTLEAALILFLFGHTFFIAQWLGINQREVET